MQLKQCIKTHFKQSMDMYVIVSIYNQISTVFTFKLILFLVLNKALN